MSERRYDGRVETEPEALRERDEQDQRPREAEREERTARGGRRRLRLRQPEPGVEGREQVDERKRVRRDDDERDQAEREQRDRVPRERLLERHRPAWDQALAADEPAGEQQRCRAARPRRPTAGRAPQRPAAAGAARPRRTTPILRRDEEQQARVAPEEQPAAQAAHRRRERDPPPPAAREQVDRADREGQQRGEQHELDRPAADEARADVDVARRTLLELEAGVERADRLCAARPSSSSRCGCSCASANARAGRSGTVVSVTAGMPRATNGPCSPSVKGKPRSSSCRKRSGDGGGWPRLLEDA